jgi:hypothetical protein
MEYTIMLKLINIFLMIFLFRKYNKKEKREDEDEDEVKDENTWYLVKDGKSQYKGEWKNGVPHGKGTKEIFAGEHIDSNGIPCHSDGKLCCHSIIKGTFANGLADGFCTQYFNQDDEETQPYYEGEFKNGCQHGQGTYYWGTGSYYKGSFVKSMFHGVGYLYNWKKNKTWVGVYENDKKLKGKWISGEL